MPPRRDAEKHKTRLLELTTALLKGDKKARQRIEKELEIHPSQVAPKGKAARESTELIEWRRQIRKPGKKGAKSTTIPIDEVLDRIVVHFDDVYRQLNEQLRLIAGIQQQVNRLVASVERRSELLNDGSAKRNEGPFPVE